MTEAVATFAPDHFAREAADRIATTIAETIARTGGCRLALSGGSTPRPVYAQLVAQARVDWSKVEILFADERAVGPEDPASNYRMVHDILVAPAAIPRARVHRIEGERPADEARARYESTVATAPIDVLLLGMGDDGHTASLFPGDDARDREGLVVVTTSPLPPTTRVSLSYRAIAAAHDVLVLVTGAGKAARLAEVFAQRAGSTPTLPAARVRPDSGRMRWLLDDEAAAELPDSSTPAPSRDPR